MLSCVEHGCLLLPERDVAVTRALGEQIKPVPAGEPLATLDRYTHTALATGRVDLPGRSVHAGVWFRGPALRAAPHLPAYEGERPVPDKWQELLAMLEGVVAQARIDRAAARRLLALLAIGCRTRARFEQYRDGLLDLEIPAEHLPTAAELGLDDLT